MKIAINGFGRIGRAAFKIIKEKEVAGEDIHLVAINDLAPVETLSYLLKFDSVYGRYERDINHNGNSLIVDGLTIPVLAEKEPEKLPWKDLGVDVVIECTGVFTKSEDAQRHIVAGAKKVLLSAPAKDEGFQTLVFGSGNVVPDKDLVSNASCTTNNVTPVIRVLNEAFGVEKAMLTTVHAYTATQGLVDAPDKKDPRRGRAAAVNIVPSSTGAADAVSLAYPAVSNIFDGIALRVPVICGSVSDITAVLKSNVSVETVNECFKAVQESDSYKGILKYSEEPLVSSDIIKSPYSSIVDGTMTRVVGGNLVKVLAWYDNEWGYTTRLVEMAINLNKYI
jgi:glyceraldehyde 3-phosphate dehydrogenase